MPGAKLRVFYIVDIRIQFHYSSNRKRVLKGGPYMLYDYIKLGFAAVAVIISLITLVWNFMNFFKKDK